MNLAETCGKENPIQIITDYKIATNITSDVNMIQERIPRIKKDSKCKTLYVNSGYYSEDVVKLAKQNEIDIHYTDMTGRNNDKKLPVHEFKIDEVTSLITSCPKGIKTIRSSFKEKVYSAHFAINACTNCELRDICHIKVQKKNCVVRFNEKTLIACKTRSAIKIELKEATSMRAAIEGSNSALKRDHSANDMKIRGLNKSTVVMGFKITAQNFKRFARHIISKVIPEPLKLAPRIVMS